jgi:hypothetical protein
MIAEKLKHLTSSYFVEWHGTEGPIVKSALSVTKRRNRLLSIMRIGNLNWRHHLRRPIQSRNCHALKVKSDG